MRRARRILGTLVVGLALLMPATVQANVAGAGFTTFDATAGGCLDSPNGINCNNYTAKDKVYMSGGPTSAGLDNGCYYFAVLVPGYQNGGFEDGATGNLSDIVAGSTPGDVGGGDTISQRTFKVTNHLITYPSTSCGTATVYHATGSQPITGKDIVQLIPFDNTSNPGGVYILAICQTGATSPSQCKYDAFRVPPSPPVTPFGVVSGAKYYDLNTNGKRDGGEVGIANWFIDYTDAVSDVIFTDTNGDFSLNLGPDTYTFAEEHPLSTAWIQTGETGGSPVQFSDSGGDSTSLLNFVYTVTVVNGGSTSGILFGNVCVGAGNGRTLGFWSNRNGAALFGSGDLALMVSLNLRNASGTDFDPGNYPAFRTWLLNATATNMAYMLSAQLAAMELNVLNGFVNGSALIYAPGTTSANTNGFATVSAVMTEANTELGTHGTASSTDSWRSYQEALKNALDKANNNLNFVQPDPAHCPTPVFPTP